MSMITNDGKFVFVKRTGGGSTVTGTDDGTNWTSITIDGNTKNIPAGGGEGGDVAKSVENTTEKWGDTYSITANTEGLDLAVELPDQEIPFFAGDRDKIGISCYLNDYAYRGEFQSIAYMPADDVVCETGLSEIKNNGDVWLQCKKRLDWDGETEFTESEYQFSGKGLTFYFGKWTITFAHDGISGSYNGLTGQHYFKSWEDFFGAN